MTRKRPSLTLTNAAAPRKREVAKLSVTRWQDMAPHPVITERVVQGATALAFRDIADAHEAKREREDNG